MSDALLNTVSPTALTARTEESRRIALMHSCAQEIAAMAHRQMHIRATDQFVILCVDILPRWDRFVDRIMNTKWRNTLESTPNPTAIISAPMDVRIELATMFPGLASALKLPVPAELAMVVVMDESGATICFIDPRPVMATRH